MQGSAAAVDKLGVDRPTPHVLRGATHAGIIALLRGDPDWLVEVLVALGHLTRVMPVEVLPTEAWPRGEEGRYRETRADLVLRLWPITVPRGPSLRRIRRQSRDAVILELQNLVDAAKLVRWSEFAFVYRAYLGANPLLVILTFDPEVATWVRNEALPRLAHVRVALLTPELIPSSAPIDPRESPHRALLDAMLHARDTADHERVARAILALREFEVDEANLYEEMLLSHLGEEMIMKAIGHLRASGQLAEDEPPLTKFELQSFLYTRGHRAGLEQGLEQGLEKGRMEGRIQALIDLLTMRGIEVDADLVAELRARAEPERLHRWLTRALVVERARDLLVD